MSSADDETGTDLDVKKVSRQILNRAVGTRTICKEECMVLLANLPLFSCSETICTVSLSGWFKLGRTKSATILTRYRNRDPSTLGNLSLHEFFFLEHPDGKHVPNCTGTHNRAVYPVTQEHAKSVLLIHKPWLGDDHPSEDGKWIDDFTTFVQSPECPISVKVNFERAKQKFEKKQTHVECVAGDIDSDIDDDEFDDDNTGDPMQEIIDVHNSLSVSTRTNLNFKGRTFDCGLDYPWDRRIYEVRTCASQPMNFSHE